MFFDCLSSRASNVSQVSEAHKRNHFKYNLTTMAQQLICFHFYHDNYYLPTYTCQSSLRQLIKKVQHSTKLLAPIDEPTSTSTHLIFSSFVTEVICELTKSCLSMSESLLIGMLFFFTNWLPELAFSVRPKINH